MKKPHKSEFLEFRDDAVEKFKKALAELQASKADIQNADHVLSRINPEHQKFNFETGEIDAPRVLIEAPSTVNHQASEARVVSPEVQVPAKQDKVKAAKKATAKAVVSGKASKIAKPSKAPEATATEIASGQKAESSAPAKPVKASTKISPKAKKAAAQLVTGATSAELESKARETINAYFSGKRPQDELANILRGNKTPVSMNAVAKFFQSIHAIDLSGNPKLPGLFKGRLQAQLSHMMTKGLVEKKNLAGEDGKVSAHYILAKGAKRKAPKASKVADVDQIPEVVGEPVSAENQSEVQAS